MHRWLGYGAACLALAAAAYTALDATLIPTSAGIHVRWSPTVDDLDRQAAEQRYGLSEGSAGDGRTWAYALTNVSFDNVRALVSDPAVEDTADIDRAAFRVTRESTRGRWPRSAAPLATRSLRAVTLLAGLLGLLGVGLGLAGRAAPRAVTALFTHTPTPAAPLSGRQRVVLALVVGGSLALNVAAMRHMTLTADEPEHLRYGQNILHLTATRFDDSKMPVSALNAVPSALAEHLTPGPLASWLARPQTARYATTVFSTLTALCVFAWARRLYGASGALLSVALYAFDPNLLAHAQLTTTDLYAAGTTAIALYCCWRLLHEGGWGWASASALALGLAQVAKYTSVVLLPLCAVSAGLFYAARRRQAAPSTRIGDRVRGGVAVAGMLLAFVAVSLLVINVAFLFDHTLTPLDQYSFRSQLLRTVQASACALGRLPMPVPHPYLEGLDLVMDHERTGVSFGPTYLFGRLSREGFAGYYFWAFLYKVPLATQTLLLGAAVLALARWRRLSLARTEWFLLIPIAFFAIYFNFFYRAQIGMRYFLVVLPLLYVLAGSLLSDWTAPPKALRMGIAAAVCGLITSLLSYYPHFLPYFNELVWDRTQAYRILADSNLDWGQYGLDLEDFRTRHPGSLFEPDEPMPGTLLVRVNMLTGVTGDPDRFRWLRDHFQPVAHVGHGILVYRVTPSDLAAAGIGR